MEINPSSEQWKRFWAKMDELDVWTWQRRYDNPRVMDGAGWDVKMEHGTKKVEAYGHNASATRLSTCPPGKCRCVDN